MTDYILFESTKGHECIDIVEADGLEDLYRILGCEIVEYAPVVIGGRLYSLILDEEGRLKENPAPTSAVYEADGKWYSFAIGRFLITPPSDTEGKDVDCTMEDVRCVADNLLTPDGGGTVLLHVGFDFPPEDDDEDQEDQEEEE